MRDDGAGWPIPGSLVPGTAAGVGAAAGTAAACQLLDIVRRLRARERGYLAGLLHDGPIQDLAAAGLELGLARRTAAAAEGDELAVPEQLVQAAGRSLRRLQDELWPFPQAELGLAAALERRTAWLLATPLVVNAGEGTAGLLAAEVQVVADIVEMILLGTVSAEEPAGALAAVQADQDLISVELNLTTERSPTAELDPTAERSLTAAGADQPSGGKAAVLAWLDGLASAMQACADVRLYDHRVRVGMRIPRRPHP